MAIGLGGLGLAPAAFWAMTPAEFAAALDGARAARGEDAASGAPARSELARLMARFPD